MITTAAAVAVCLAIEQLTELHPQIKWINDLYLNGKKICGILTEAVSDLESGGIESVIIGIGLNCTTPQDTFPEELRAIAGSLRISGTMRNKLAAGIINELFTFCYDLNNPALMEEYKKRSLMVGKTITYNKGRMQVSGTVLDINEHGNLVVETNSGEIDVLFSGEITIGENTN
jgi:BirA family biotin operon repressor/biotin-[acetyl-CoA-carboxylase] ligase